ncbi:hypothetical protein J6590_091329, partial [Homalodisca vitripennis]
AITDDGGNGANEARSCKMGMSQVKSRTKMTIKELSRTSAITADGGNGANEARGSKVGMCQVKSRTKMVIKELSRTCDSEHKTSGDNS